MKAQTSEVIKNIQGKVAIITGGTRGIGFAVAIKLLELGYTVVLCSRTHHELQKAVVHLRKINNNCYGLPVDISRDTECRKLIYFTQKKLGRIDVLINNAGVIGDTGQFHAIKPKEWRKVLNINLLGTIQCTRLVIPEMIKIGGGKIINLCGGGIGSKNTIPLFSAYITSKIAIVGFTEVLAAELIDNNIQVNCIAPGSVNTEITESLFHLGPEKIGYNMYEKIVEQRQNGGTPVELTTKLVAFLVSKKSNHISGRLLSAKWDKIKDLKKIVNFENDVFKLRRIDNQLYYEK